MRKVSLLLFCWLGLISAPVWGQGSWEWSKLAASTAKEQIWDVAVDGQNGAVYAVGEWGGADLSDSLGSDFTTGGGGLDGAVLKYDLAGNYQWGFSISNTGDQVCTGVEVDGDGNIYVCGFFERGTNFKGVAGRSETLTNIFNKDAFLAKYSSTGHLIWAAQIGWINDAFGEGLTCDTSGVYLTGSYKGTSVKFNSASTATPSVNIGTTPTTTGRNAFICRYDTGGTVIWGVDAGDGAGNAESGKDVAIDDQYAYVIGHFDSPKFRIFDGSRSGVTDSLINTGGTDVFIMALSKKNGELVWHENLNCPRDDFGNGIEVREGFALITGSVDESNIGFPGAPTVQLSGSAFAEREVFIAALDTADGQGVWARIERGAGEDEACDIDADGLGNVWITGAYKSTLDLSGTVLTSLGQEDIFLAQYEITTGNLLRADRAGDPDKDIANGVSVTGNSVFLGGVFHGDANFPPLTPVTHDNSNNMFVAGWEPSLLANPDSSCGVEENVVQVNVLDNDQAGSSIGLHIDSLLILPGSGTATFLNDSTINYVPNAGFFGRDSVLYRACNSSLYCDSSWLYLTIIPAADAGLDASLCGPQNILLNGNTPAPGTGNWQFLSGGGSISNPTFPASGLSGLTMGINELEWTISTGSCNSKDTVEITVNSVPTSTLTASNLSFCEGDSTQLAINLTGNGPWEVWVFDGTTTTQYPGIVSSPLNIMTSPTASLTIMLDSAQDANGCRDTLLGLVPQNVNITVFPNPTASYTGLGATYCENEPIVSLSGNPGSGVFTGPGITGNQFLPAGPGAGTHEIIYTYTDGNSCVGADTQTTVVHPLPLVSFSGLSATTCIDGTPQNLIGSPVAGTFSGPGISGSQFDPAAAGVGVKEVIYTYTDGNSCTVADTQQIIVNALPVVSFSGLPAAICLAGTTITLTGNPVGGTFSGPGISGNQFQPIPAGSGTHEIIYQYTDGNSCVAADSQMVTVNALPVVASSGLSAQVCISVGPISLSGNPGGGTFSGPGVTGTQFDPPTAGSGNFDVIYAYTDGNGCIGRDTQAVVVNSLPIVSFAGLPATICGNDAGINLSGNPVGGTFTGPGISGVQFDPQVAGPGVKEIIYTYTDGNSCTSADSQMVTVNSPPTVSFSGLNAAYCLNSTVAILTGSPIGGTYTGPGITGTQFDPMVAGVGNPEIIYAFTDANSCTSRDTQSTVVNALPNVSFTGLPLEVCEEGGSQNLIGTPSGGVFTGPGISGSQFDPVVAGIGVKEVIYTFTDGNSCTVADTQQIIVHPQPIVSFSGLPAAICLAGTTVALTGNPTGGTFSGPGISGNQFQPVPAGAGTHEIIYQYTDGNSCIASDTQMVTVNALPVVSSSGLLAQVCIASGSRSLTGSPVGGIFSGPGVAGTQFDPSTAGLGNFDVIYTFTDGNGCIGRDTQAVVVNSLPIVSFTGLPSSICGNDAAITLTGNPVGGTFTGPGILGVQFDPQVAGPGVKEIIYTYTGGNNCTAADTQMVTVNSPPVVSFAGLNTAYCLNNTVAILTGSPTSGTFTGPGITGSQFDPMMAGVGNPEIIYAFTDANSCTARDTQRTVVNVLPNVSFTGLPVEVCLEGGVQSLLGTPSGGVFAGSGISGSQFEPLVAGVGTYPVNYTFTDGNSCTAADTQQVIVHAQPLVSFSGLPAAICEVDTSVALTGNQIGGTFSGPGINGTAFEPLVAGAGPHEIVYLYTDANTCSASDTLAVSVNALPIVQLSGLPDSTCSQAIPVSLLGSPTGGSFSGVGITGNQFDPVSAGVGVFEVVYAYSDANSCLNTDTATVFVGTQLNVSFSGLDPGYCEQANDAMLTGQPAGGIFVGPGITGSIFTPLQAGVGTHSIEYRYEPGNGCGDTVSSTVEIYPEPIVNLMGIDPMYCINETPVPVIGEPAGGVFVGAGLGNGTFDPIGAGTGVHPAKYVFTSAQGCMDSTTVMTEVFSLPDPVFAGMDLEYQLGDRAVLQADPLNNGSGTWSTLKGDGQIEDSFQPYTEAKNLSEGENIFQWTGENGACIVQDEVIVTLIPFPEKRGLSPNGDDKNDLLRFTGLEFYPESRLEILSRWGSPVFASEDYQNDWQGNSNSGESLPDDTYYFVLTLPTGEQYKGFVVVIR